MNYGEKNNCTEYTHFYAENIILINEYKSMYLRNRIHDNHKHRNHTDYLKI